MSESETVTVLIPTPLRKFTDGAAKVSAAGSTVGDVLSTLGARYPGLKERICTEDGEIRRFMNVFVNGENARDGEGAATAVRPGDEIGIIPAMAGGSATEA
ncbi:MAG: ubiquitin-like small modifier protein 1 [Thermomicrobiales bacterium]